MTTKSQKKHALLIGIDVYPHFPKQNQLESCVNDTELMAKVLEEPFGFEPGDIRFLCNEEATYEGICAAMDELIHRASDDDIVVVHYSGHGSQRRNPEGYDADGRDETIVPYDSGRNFPEMSFPNRDITDDQFYAWLLKLNARTANVTMIFDSCHAGTLTRNSGGRARRVPADMRTVEDQHRPEGGRRLQGDPRKRSARARFGDQHVLVAACREDETAKEYRAMQHGALTYFLCQELVRTEPGETYRDLFERFAPRLTARFRSQRPQLEGAWDRLVFGIEDFEPMRYLTVDERTNDHVLIGAGAAHGLSVGSEWSIYPPGTRRLDTQTLSCGHVRVQKVNAVSASAKILQEKPPHGVVIGSRAVERIHDYGEMQWPVDIRGESRRSVALRKILERLIEASTLLYAATAGEMGKAVIQLGTSADKDDGVVTVIGESGELLLEPVEEESTDPKELINGLERWCRYNFARELENHNPVSVLYKKADVAFLRCDPKGDWQLVEATPETEIVYEEGEHLALRVTNHYDKPIYVNVLDFGLTGSISQLYPVPGAREALSPGRFIEIGTRRGDEIEVFLPEGFPFMPEDEAGGKEYVKVFATTRQADFRWLTQKGIRGHRHPLERLLQSTLQGSRRGESRCVPTDDWTTVTRSFFVRHKAS